MRSQSGARAQYERNLTGDSIWANPTTASSAATARLQPYYPQPIVTQKSPVDSLGLRVDSAAVVNSFNTVPYSGIPLPAQPRAGPSLKPQLSLDTVPSRPASLPRAKTTGYSPAPELAQSYQAITGRKMDEIRGPRQRYSDELKESKVQKKKSGFSSFFNLSSPRRPAISAPENPVHVTHVGYDQETGEFTVCHSVYS